MKRTTIPITAVIVSFLLSSCGEEKETPNNSSSTKEEALSPKEQELSQKVEAKLKPEIAKHSSKLILNTPDHLEIEGPKKDISYDEASELITATYTWKWRSKEALYKISPPPLQINQDKEIYVLEETVTTGEVVAGHGLKVILSEGDDGKLSIVGQKETAGSHKGSSFRQYGVPRFSYEKETVVLGSKEHSKVVAQAKQYKDKVTAERAAKNQAEAIAREERRKKNMELLRPYIITGNVFSGTLVAKDPGSSKEISTQMKLVFDSVSEKGGILQLDATMTQTFTSFSSKVKAPATFKGSFNEEGNLVFRTTKHWGVSNGKKWVLIGKPNQKFILKPTDSTERLSLGATTPPWELSGNLVKQ